MNDKMTVEEFLSAGHKFVDGDIIKGIYNQIHIGNDCAAEYWNEPYCDSELRFVISAKALEKPMYTKAMKDAGDDIEVGMLYLNEDGEECEFIGENNGMILAVGKLTKKGVHPRHLHICDKGECNPIDTPKTPSLAVNIAIDKKETKMIKYEKVTDLTLNEIAKAMIDGEVFYGSNGCISWSWVNGRCVDSIGNECRIGGDYYRKVELTPMEAAKKACGDFMAGADSLKAASHFGEFIVDSVTDDADKWDEEYVEACRTIVNAYDDGSL